MFKKSIDSKSTFFRDGIEMVDLTEPIFKTSDLTYHGIISYYKVSKDMEMRPDKLGYAAYGDISYAEIILKESGIDNPFTIEFNDDLLIPSLNTVYTNIKDLDEFDKNPDYVRAASGKDTPYDLIANYHKYIDKNKLPKGNGSDVAAVSIPSTNTSIDPNLLSSTYNGVTSSGRTSNYFELKDYIDIQIGNDFSFSNVEDTLSYDSLKNTWNSVKDTIIKILEKN